MGATPCGARGSVAYIQDAESFRDARLDRRTGRLMDLLWDLIDTVLADDQHAERRLRELRDQLAGPEHRAIEFVVDAVEVMLAIHSDRVTPAVVTRHGGRWRIEWGARAVIVDHSVGMLHLAVLMANPDVEIPAIELAAGLNAVAQAAGTTSVQPVLDSRAIQTYRRRLTELRDDNTPSARRERDWMLAELSAATGLGGRLRAFTDDQERARVAVGRAIRRAMTRIEQADAVVGAHLRAAVHTGIRCWYRPS